MQQQPPPPSLKSGPPPPLPSNSIITEQIQRCLDENKNLILAILENQNLGKLVECGQLQALLQKNLMYLAAIADAQPLLSGPSQMVPPNSVAQHANYMQQPHGAMPQLQQGGDGGVPKSPFQLNALRSQDQQQQLPHFQQQQQIHSQIGLRPGANNGMHALQHGLGSAGGLLDARGNRQDVFEDAFGDGQGKSASGRGNSNRESLNSR